MISMFPRLASSRSFWALIPHLHEVVTGMKGIDAGGPETSCSPPAGGSASEAVAGRRQRSAAMRAEMARFAAETDASIARSERRRAWIWTRLPIPRTARAFLDDMPRVYLWGAVDSLAMLFLAAALAVWDGGSERFNGRAFVCFWIAACAALGYLSYNTVMQERGLARPGAATCAVQ
jgi:hypothetical protein